MFDQVTPSSSSVFGLKEFSILTVVPRRGLQQCYNNISVFILVCHVFMSSLLTKPLVQHHLSRVSPIQLRDFHYTSGTNRRFLERKGASIRSRRVLESWEFRNHFL